MLHASSALHLGQLAIPAGSPATVETALEVAAMIGDVNLFFNIAEEPQTAEIEVMIAEPGSRRKGYGPYRMLRRH